MSSSFELSPVHFTAQFQAILSIVTVTDPYITYKENRPKVGPFHNCHFDLPGSAPEASVQTAALSACLNMCLTAHCSSVRVPTSLILAC